MRVTVPLCGARRLERHGSQRNMRCRERELKPNEQKMLIFVYSNQCRRVGLLNVLLEVGAGAGVRGCRKVGGYQESIYLLSEASAAGLRWNI